MSEPQEDEDSWVVLTFHRTSVKSDDPSTVTTLNNQRANEVVFIDDQQQDHHGNQQGPGNEDARKGVGGILKKPTISLLPFGGITSNIMGPVSPTPGLKLTNKALTLEKDALLTDQYPSSIPGYPSDRRSLIALEIFTTERSFVRQLEIAIKIFLRRIEDSKLLDDKEFYSVFSNIEDIFELNKELLGDIFDRISAWSDKQCIGDLFLKYVDRFSIYAEYCKNYDTGEEIIKEKKKNSRFETMLNECYSNPKCMPGHPLSSYLITIIQRFPRYVLLLKDLAKRTEERHPDLQNLKDALKMVEEKTAYINEQLEQAQCQKALSALQTKVSGLSQYDSEDRTFVHEGSVFLLTGKMSYKCVLFSDVIVFAHIGENKEPVVDFDLPLKTVWVEDLKTFCPQTANEDAIGVYTPDRPYRMYVGTPGEKKIWLQKIKGAITALLSAENAEGEDCEIRKATHVYKQNGAVYDGFFLNTKRHGHGKMTIPNLMTYEGEWEDDERNGKGMAKFCTGEVYEGMWRDDKQDGYGTFKYSTGDEITCEWREGLKVGPCAINFKNGDRFKGECVNGQIQGLGELVCKDGLRYNGNWLKNMKHGDGNLELRDGTKYKGSFIRDKYHGVGELRYADGSRYKGLFEHGVRCGEGKLTDNHGNVYEGRWVDDKKDGQGKMIYSNKDEYQGMWTNDVRHGQGEMKYAQGAVAQYKGVWENDIKHGNGILTLRNGDIYTGEFSMDMISGTGKMKYKDGSKFDGGWRNGLPNGEGKWTKPSLGWTCHGLWKEGKQNGHCIVKDTLNDYEYDGDWVHGIKEGDGREVKNGFTYDGSFREDMYHGFGVEESSDKSRYEGEWHWGVKHGKGTLKHVNGMCENQTWRHGYLIETPLVLIPRERTPIQRWMDT